MSSIYKFNEEWSQLLAALEESEGVLTPELEDKMAELHKNIDSSIENAVYAIKALSGEVDLIKEEIDRLTRRANSRINSINRIKEMLLTCLSLTNLDKVKDPKYTVFIKKTKSVNITGDVPEEFCRKIPEKIEPDKIKIKEFLSSGGVATWSSLQDNKSIVIN